MFRCLSLLLYLVIVILLPCFSSLFSSTACSYLALVCALASEADYVFIPEDPPKSDWPEKLCKKLEQVLCLNIAGVSKNLYPLAADRRSNYSINNINIRVFGNTTTEFKRQKTMLDVTKLMDSSMDILIPVGRKLNDDQFRQHTHSIKTIL